MPKMKKGGNDGAWVEVPVEETDTHLIAKGKKTKKVFKVFTFRGRQEKGWLDSGLWQPLQETVIPQSVKMGMIEVHYGTFGSDGMRRDGAPGGSYPAVYEQYRMQGGDVYTRDEARNVHQWDTRKPIPGFDPKLGSKTLDIFSED